MPWLEKRGETYRIKFRYAGRSRQVALGAADRLQAERDLARFEDNLLLLERGRLELPAGADVGRFLLTDGKVSGKAAPPAALPQLAESLDEEPAQPPRGRHVLRGGPPQLDRRGADLHRARWAVPSYPTVVCHCLLLQEGTRLALVDTGIGLRDVHRPVERLGQPLIDAAGFQFTESDTAARRIEALGLNVEDVGHVVLTHADPDHTGGLADFPDALVHISEEELARVSSGHWRYVPAHFDHGPRWKPLGQSARRWFGLEARTVETGFTSEVLLVPLFGHTLGHCGVAVQQGDRWVLHVGDAYYLKAELTADDHPVSLLAAQRADDDGKRRTSLAELRRLVRDHSGEIDVIGYHDLSELPSDYPLP